MRFNDLLKRFSCTLDQNAFPDDSASVLSMCRVCCLLVFFFIVKGLGFCSCNFKSFTFPRQI